MNNSIFTINEEPYCIWGDRLKENNKEFIEGIDAQHFSYIYNILSESEDEKKAITAIKLQLHHSIETFYSFVGVLLQAPDCGYAWISRCSTGQLRAFVKNISRHEGKIFNKHKIENINWESISNLVFTHYEPETERKELAEKFCNFWIKLADLFTDKNNIDEYNSLKHGFRVTSGGFSIGVAPHNDEKHPSKLEYKSLGGSKHGISYFKVESLSTNKNEKSSLKSTKVSLNWKKEEIEMLSQLVYFSINNIITSLKVYNQINQPEDKFLYPVDLNVFKEVWEYTSGVTSMKMSNLNNNNISHIPTKDELLTCIDKYMEWQE